MDKAIVENKERPKTQDLEKKESERKKQKNNKELGKRGEEAACRYLKQVGYEILNRNWVCKAGEADIIARDEDTLVFVEVKTRSNSCKGLPSESVDEKKRKRYERIAATYLLGYEAVDIAVRFDVISLLVVSPDRAFLRHHVNAFVS